MLALEVEPSGLSIPIEYTWNQLEQTNMAKLDHPKEARSSGIDDLIAAGDAQAIVRQLRVDQDSCARGKLPSLLAVNLKERRKDRNLVLRIATCLQSESGLVGLPPSILLLQYESIVDGIKAHIHQLGDKPTPSEDVKNEAKVPMPSTSDLETTITVLQGLIDTSHLAAESLLSSVINQIRWQLASGTTHPGYTSLCQSCGAFNITSSKLSLPPNLILDNKTALVTGARLNLGFHTTLRLLRSGAKVIATSRYPGDAEKRYESQRDFYVWKSHLRIVGADFRAAKDVFSLVSVVKRILKKWGDELNVPSRLDILVNNAAQTLTDSIETERKAIENESDLQKTGRLRLVEYNDGYVPCIRGGASLLRLEVGTLKRSGDSLLELGATNNGWPQRDLD